MKKNDEDPFIPVTFSAMPARSFSRTGCKVGFLGGCKRWQQLFSATTTWHADVTFNADGTTRYDEPASPGSYLAYGIWLLTSDQIHWDMGPGTSCIFDGTITVKGTCATDVS